MRSSVQKMPKPADKPRRNPLFLLVSASTSRAAGHWRTSEGSWEGREEGWVGGWVGWGGTTVVSGHWHWATTSDSEVKVTVPSYLKLATLKSRHCACYAAAASDRKLLAPFSSRVVSCHCSLRATEMSECAMSPET